jgi:putative transposase
VTAADLVAYAHTVRISGRVDPGSVFAGQSVGIKEVHDDIWLVSFLDYDLGYFDLETRLLEPLENPFGPKVLPMS